MLPSVSCSCTQRAKSRYMHPRMSGFQILSNCLLVLGCAFLLGGIKYTVQRFNRPAAVTNCAMMMLAVVTLLFPDVMENSHDISECRMLGMSRMISVIMLLVYGELVRFRCHCISSCEPPSKSIRNPSSTIPQGHTSSFSLKRTHFYLRAQRKRMTMIWCLDSGERWVGWVS